jgi:hypothetical protein
MKTPISRDRSKRRGWNPRRDPLARAVARHAERISRLLGGSAIVSGQMQNSRQAP